MKRKSLRTLVCALLASLALTTFAFADSGPKPLLIVRVKDAPQEPYYLDLLADWTADLTVDLGLDMLEKNPDERKIKDIEPIRYEKYDYVMIVCRNEVDYLNLIRALGIDGAKVLVAKQRRIKARAVWYDDMKAQIVPKEDAPQTDPENPEKEEEND
jgi:hypothetical protein